MPCLLSRDLDECDRHPETWQRVEDLLNEIVDLDALDRIWELVQSGNAVWRIDPDHPEVFGLVQPGTLRAFMVVYLEEEDFETSEEFWKIDE